MTGHPVYYKKKEERPDYPRMIIKFTNGYNLVYDCMRMLGQITLITDRNKFLEAKKMGPDAWKHIDSTTKFIGLFKNKKGMIKTALIDQRLIAGIGNECSDEILFQSGIHPKTDIKKLDKEKLKKIFRNMRSVLKTKIKSGFDYDKLPDSYIFKHRSKGAECPNCGGTIEKIKVGGRSAYYCPNCQPKATGSRK